MHAAALRHFQNENSILIKKDLVFSYIVLKTYSDYIDNNDCYVSMTRNCKSIQESGVIFGNGYGTSLIGTVL